MTRWVGLRGRAIIRVQVLQFISLRCLASGSIRPLFILYLTLLSAHAEWPSYDENVIDIVKRLQSDEPRPTKAKDAPPVASRWSHAIRRLKREQFCSRPATCRRRIFFESPPLAHPHMTPWFAISLADIRLQTARYSGSIESTTMSSFYCYPHATATVERLNPIAPPPCYHPPPYVASTRNSSSPLTQSRTPCQLEQAVTPTVSTDPSSDPILVIVSRRVDCWQDAILNAWILEPAHVHRLCRCHIDKRRGYRTRRSEVSAVGWPDGELCIVGSRIQVPKNAIADMARMAHDCGVRISFCRWDPRFYNLLCLISTLSFPRSYPPSASSFHVKILCIYRGSSSPTSAI